MGEQKSMTSSGFSKPPGDVGGGGNVGGWTAEEGSEGAALTPEALAPSEIEEERLAVVVGSV